MFKASAQIRAKTVTDKEVIEHIKELPTWDVVHHIQIIMTHSVTYKGFSMCIKQSDIHLQQVIRKNC
jgi:pterin-4a-carbinolamine dehydratase